MNLSRYIFPALLVASGLNTARAYDGAVTVLSRAGIGSGAAAYAGGPTGGGAFKLTANPALDPLIQTGVPGVVALNPNQFLSFCIERNEFINFGGTYQVSISDGADKGGLGDSDGSSLTPDPISRSTAWLFRKFTDGTLNSDASGFQYNNSGGNQLQTALWFLENEIIDAIPHSSYRFLVDTAMTANGFVAPITGFTAADYAAARVQNNNGGYGVKVLNMYSVTSKGVVNYHQDVLAVVVPEPSTIVAGGLALIPLLFGTLASGSRKKSSEGKSLAPAI